MPGPSPWLLILAALAAGALLAAFAGVHPRVTFRAVIGLCIALVLPATMPSRTERPKGARLGDIATKWTRPQPTSEDSE
jgi:hypothetical protein